MIVYRKRLARLLVRQLQSTVLARKAVDMVVLILLASNKRDEIELVAAAPILVSETPGQILT